MITARQTIIDARRLQSTLSDGSIAIRVDLTEAYLLIRCGQVAMREIAEKQRAEKRAEYVRRGDVANAVQDMRAVGHWDGE